MSPVADPQPESALKAPIVFRPCYQTLVWGGRRMQAYRKDLPEGPIGESWEISDQERGMSVVADGPLVGQSLQQLVAAHPESLVGAGYTGRAFPLMVKLIDAADSLSVQVHPDDQLAREMDAGPSGKTECWLIVGEGGFLYQGTRPGVDREGFERALATGGVLEALNRYECRAHDFFLLPARTVHALGAGCLLYEVQQSSDITFRVWDWGRLGLDGKPRPMHVQESLRTIDFSRSDYGPLRSSPRGHSAGGAFRALGDCQYFRVEERLLPDVGDATRHHGRDDQAGEGRSVCSVVSCVRGAGRIETASGTIALSPMQTALVPAAAGGFRAVATSPDFRLLHAVPHLA